MRKFDEHPGRILILEHKHGTYPVFARTREEEDSAYLFLFRFLDEVGFYTWMKSEHQQWYDAAKDGDAAAARQLMMARGDYEYERVWVEHVETP